MGSDQGPVQEPAIVIDIDLMLEIEERLVGVVSRLILGAVSVGNQRVRASDFNFRYAALNGTKSRPESNFPSDRFRPGAEVPALFVSYVFGHVRGDCTVFIASAHIGGGLAAHRRALPIRWVQIVVQSSPALP
jgi:hypothetical protein